MEKILIMGLPGAGKTTLAKALVSKLLEAGSTVKWFNADQVRKDNDDWDFSDSGRMRQAHRMNKLAKDSDADFVVCDFVCPTPLLRAIFAPHYNVWVDTIRDSRYEDTNDKFTPPSNWNYRVIEQDADKYAELIADELLNKDNKNGSV
jgi:adenylylsulfate kinase